VFARFSRHLVAHWLETLGFTLVFLAIVTRGERRKSGRFMILRGPFLIIAKARGFLLAKPLYESILSRNVIEDPRVDRHSAASARLDLITKRMERYERMLRTLTDK